MNITARAHGAEDLQRRSARFARQRDVRDRLQQFRVLVRTMRTFHFCLNSSTCAIIPFGILVTRPYVSVSAM